MAELNNAPRFKKVMLIDDTAVDRVIAERQMKKNSFADEIVLKESASAALTYLTTLENSPQLPQLIFLDICMPDKNGFDFLEDYEKLPEAVKKDCIIIMLSTSLNADDHERAEKNKYVSKFMNKPLNAEKLKELNSEQAPPNKAA